MRYWRRYADSFRIMDHSELADMFGRPPHPKLKASIRLQKGATTSRNTTVTDVQAIIIVTVENEGRGIAKYPFLEIKVSPKSFLDYDSYFSCAFQIDELYRNQNTGTLRIGTTSDAVIHSGMVQDFYGFSKALAANVNPEDIRVDSVLYAENMQPVIDSHLIKSEEIYDKLFRRTNSEE